MESSGTTAFPKHPLHVEIGDFLSRLSLPAGCKPLLARECGGSQNLPLFCSTRKGNDSEYCNVDALIIRNGSVRLILEIEESGLLPTKICGKLLTSALSTHFIHDVLDNAATPIDDETTFIQVLDCTSLQPKTKKFEQGKALEASIQHVLPLRDSRITRYRMFFFSGPSEFRANPKKRKEFETAVLEACECRRD